MTTHHDQPDELVELEELMRDERDYSDGPSPAERQVRRTRLRRGLLAFAIVTAVVVAAVGGYVGWALNAPLGAPLVSSQAPRVVVPDPAAIRLPIEGASAISVAGADEYLGPTAGGTWTTSGTNDARSIASISKVITALVVLDAKPLASAEDPGPTLRFDKADHDLYDKYYVLGATIASMPIGSTMSQRDALAMMLIPSASNYAEALTTWAFGSQRAFSSAARDWLAAHGLTGTTIVEPTGISALNVSTPGDLLAIGKLAAANPVIADIVAMPWIAIPELGRMTNTNDLVGLSGITGLKTGNLGEGTFNLLYTASVDVGAAAPLSVTGVFLGGHSRQTVGSGVVALLESIRAGFHDVPLAAEGDEIGTYETPWGATARIVVGEDASIFTWSDTAITVAMDLSTPVSYRDGEVIGSVTWTAGPHTATAAVEIEGDIEPPTAWWRLTHPWELGDQ